MAALGKCVQCAGDLCTRGGEVGCIMCGLPVPGHPQTIANREADAKKKMPKYPRIDPMGNAASWPERLLAMEKKYSVLLERVAALESTGATPTRRPMKTRASA